MKLFGKKWLVFLIVIALLVCFDAMTQESDLITRGIVIGVSLDLTDSFIELGAQVILPKNESGASNDFTIFTASGKTIKEAVSQLNTTLGATAGFAHVSAAVFGLDFLKSEYVEAIDYLLASEMLSDNVFLLAAQGKGKDVLAANVPINEVASYQLSRLLGNKSKEVGITVATLKNYAMHSYMPGGISYMPLAVKTETEFSPTGASEPDVATTELIDLTRSVIVDRNGYLLTLERDENYGLSFVNEKLTRGTLVYDADVGGYGEVSLLKSKARIKVDGNRDARVIIDLSIKPVRRSDAAGVPVLSATERLKLEDSISSKVKACFETCRESGADVYHLGERFYRKYGQEWLDGAGEYYLSEINFETEVRLKFK